MSNQAPRITIAGQRESHTLCAGCSADIRFGDSVAICRDCGSIHHEICWRQAGRCRAYQCSPDTNVPDHESGAEAMHISAGDLAAATPLPPAPERVSTDALLAQLDEQPKRWNRTALWAFGVALAGIPLFGIVTGLIAMVLACVALVAHTHRRRGMGLAVAAMLLGLIDVVGWSIGLSHYLGTPHAAVSLAELAIDPDSINDLPQHIARAMRANVLLQVDGGLGRQGIGSGVILKVRDGNALIVTNRHVIDGNFSDDTRSAPENLSELSKVGVMTLGQRTVDGKIEWVAPHGVDLAIVSAPIDARDVEAAQWLNHANPHIGDKVIAVGNPHGLGWTLSEGNVSQMRRQHKGAFDYRVLQSTAAINPGNSGGGLYDEQGRLIGINTLTGDKRVAEGLGFSISFQTLLDIVPAWLELPAGQAAEKGEKHERDE